MRRSIIKMLQITVKNFKNVLNGTIDLATQEQVQSGKSSILGIYGQNGSGKTSILDAVSLLQKIISGRELPDLALDYINTNEKSAEIEIVLYLKHIIDYKIKYRVIFEKNIAFSKLPDYRKYINPEAKPSYPKVLIKDEILEYWSKEKDAKIWNKKKTYLHVKFFDSDYRKNDVGDSIYPKYMVEKILSYSDKEYFLDMLREKAIDQNQSLIFSDDLLNLIAENDVKFDEFNLPLVWLIQNYFMRDLFIIDNQSLSLSGANILLPISIRNFTLEKSGINEEGSGVIPILLKDSSILPDELFQKVRNSLKASNEVLSSLIPDFKVDVDVIAKRRDEDGTEVSEFELLSLRKGVKIPLRYESDGIKKMVAFVHILIAMYNHENITVFIDEFDSGIFEYLLGELLSVLEEGAKGQLVFTSHNLRPLEVLNKNNLVFTTTNPNNRFIKFKHVKPTHNLRDFYYRDLVLDIQDEQTYDKTSQALINRAFRKAGLL